MKLKRYPKATLKKYYADQLLLTPIIAASEPHKIVRCCKCDEAKHLDWHKTGDGEMYYKCLKCGFESEPLGQAPAWLK